MNTIHSFNKSNSLDKIGSKNRFITKSISQLLLTAFIATNVSSKSEADIFNFKFSSFINKLFCKGVVEVKTNNVLYKWKVCNTDLAPQDFYKDEDNNEVTRDKKFNYLGALYNINYAKSNNVCPTGYNIATLDDYLSTKYVVGGVKKMIKKLNLPLSGLQYNTGIYNELNENGYLLFSDGSYVTYNNHGHDEIRKNWYDYYDIKAPIRCVKKILLNTLDKSQDSKKNNHEFASVQQNNSIKENANNTSSSINEISNFENIKNAIDNNSVIDTEDKDINNLISQGAINNFDNPELAVHKVDCDIDIKIGNYIWKSCNLVDPKKPSYKGLNPKLTDDLGRVIGSFYVRANDNINSACPTGYRLPTIRDIEGSVELVGGYKTFIDILQLPFSGLRYSDEITYAEKDKYGYIHLADSSSYFTYDKTGNIEIRVNYADAETIAIPIRCIKGIKDNPENLTSGVNMVSINSLFSYKYPYSDIVDCDNITSKHINFLKKFEVSELICSSSEEDLQKISQIKKETGVKPIKYDWMAAVGYFSDDYLNTAFAETVYNNWEKYSLNNDLHTIYHNLGSSLIVDLYLDYGNSKLREKKAKWWIENELKGVFEGIFFDWAGDGWGDLESYWVEEKFKKLMQNYYNRHPNLPYNKAELYYLYKLKELKKDIVLVTNQAIFSDPLPKGADMDMVESSITSDAWSQDNPSEYCKDIYIKELGNIYACDTWYRDLHETIAELSSIESKIKLKYPHLKEIVLNYAYPKYKKLVSGEYLLEKNKEVIYYNYAVARLFENVYSMTDFPSIYEKIDTGYTKYTDQLPFVDDKVYSVNLGKIRGNNYIYRKAENLYLRFYDNGFVLVFNGNSSKDIEISITDSGVKKVYDVYNEKTILLENDKLKLSLSPHKSYLNNKNRPIGRVYLYIKEENQ